VPFHHYAIHLPDQVLDDADTEGIKSIPCLSIVCSIKTQRLQCAMDIEGAKVMMPFMGQVLNQQGTIHPVLQGKFLPPFVLLRLSLIQS
jgi:hypothetical protein